MIMFAAGLCSIFHHLWCLQALICMDGQSSLGVD